MANRYANLVGGNKIRDEYSKINAGFDAVETEMDGKVSKSGDTSTGNQIIKNASSYQYWGVRRDVSGIEYGAELAVSAQGYAQIGRRVAGSLAALGLFLRDDNAYIGTNGIWHAGNLPYEIGTWTPELQIDGSALGIAYTDRFGRYTRIGNKVIVDVDIILSSKGSNIGDVRIAGLPFASSASRPYSNAPAGFGGVVLPASATGIVFFISTNSSFINLRQVGNDVAISTTITDAQLKNTSVIRGQITYTI